MNDKTIEWLLQGEPWIEYRTRVDLLEQSAADPQVVAARKAMLADPKIKSLLGDLAGWPGEVLNSHVIDFLEMIDIQHETAKGALHTPGP